MKNLILILLLGFGNSPIYSQASQWLHTTAVNIVSLQDDQFNNLFVVGNFNKSFSENGIFYTVAGTSDIFIRKINPEARVIWTTTIGGSGTDSVSGMSFHKSGYLWITGNYTGTLLAGNFTITSAGGQDVFLIKLDAASGKVIQVLSGGSIGNDTGISIYVEENKNMILCGVLAGNFNFAGIPIPGQGGKDVFILKLDSSLQLIWNNRISGLGDQDLQCSYLNSENDLILSGKLYSLRADFGTTQIISSPPTHYITRLDSNGNFLWQFISDFEGDYTGITMDQSKRIYACGSTSSSFTCSNGVFFPTQSNENILAVKLDTSGNLIWVKTWGNVGQDFASSISTNSYNRIMLSGQFELALSIGNHNLIAGNKKRSFFCMMDTAMNPQLSIKSQGNNHSGRGLILQTDTHYYYWSGRIYEPGEIQVGDLVSASDSGSFITRLRTYNGFTGGKLFIDDNGNGKYNPGERGIPNILVSCTNGEHVLSNERGEYKIPHSTGSFQFSFKNTAFLLQNGSFITNATVNGWNDTARYIPYTENKLLKNLNLDLRGLGQVKPGGYMCYQIDCNNQGTVADDAIVLLKLDTSLNFINSTILPDSILGDSIIWNIGTIAAHSGNSFRILCKADSNLSIGLPIFSWAGVYQSPTEVFTSDNYQEHYSRIDTVTKEGYISVQNRNPATLKYDYIFENHRKEQVSSILFKDTLEPKQSFAYMYFIHCSHLSDKRIRNSGETFVRIDGVNLPNMTIDPMHGWAVYSMAIQVYPFSYSTDTFTNTFHYCYDYEPYRKTDTCFYIFYPSGGKNSELQESPYRIFPNPVKNQFTLEKPSNYSGLIKSISLETLLGQVIYKIENEDFANGNLTIKTNDLPNGIILLKIEEQSKVYYHRVVIE